MKKNMVFSGLIGLLLVLGLFFSGCDTGSGGGGNSQTYTSTDSSGNTYNLTITESAATYAAQTGDAYILKITIGGVTKTSSGTVASAGATIQLQPSSGSSITVTISGASMTGIEIRSGVKYDDGTTIPPKTTTLTPKTSTPSTGADPFDGTSWRGTISSDGVPRSVTLTFVKSNWTMTMTLNGTTDSTGGTYTVTGNNTANLVANGQTVTATISGRNLVLMGSESDSVTFTKVN
jgi:hypothetical protein